MRMCVGWPKHVHKTVTTGILSILECLKVHVLQAVEPSIESNWGPQSLLTKSGWRKQTSKETLRRRREWESETKSGGCLNQWKRRNCTVACGDKEIETDVRCVLRSREAYLRQDRRCVREWHAAENPQERERLVYSRMNFSTPSPPFSPSPTSSSPNMVLHTPSPSSSCLYLHGFVT